MMSVYVLLKSRIDPTHRALSPFTSMNLMFSIASAIYEEIDTLAWLNFSMTCKFSASFDFSLGNHNSESSSLTPTYSTRSWKTCPKTFKQSQLI